MRKITCYLILFLFSVLSFGQVPIGNGNNESQNLPFEPYYGYSYTQTVYLASEINASRITSYNVCYTKLLRFFKVLDNPVLFKKQKTEFIFSFLDQASESVLKSFIRMVVTNRREQFLKVILLSYLDIYRNEHDIFSGKLIVASDVNTELEKKLISVIENKTKGVVEIEKTVRPEIIGGFISYNFV